MFYLAVLPVIIVTVFYSIVAALSRPFDRSARVYHALMRGWSRAMLWLLRVRMSVTGRENLVPGTPYIFVANHASYLDIIAIGAALPEGGLFVYKEELTSVPIWGWSLKVSPFIMVRRSDPRHAMRSIETAAEEIRRKRQSVVIFPEGTRSEDGTLGPFKRGGFLLAAKTGVALVPLAVRGTAPLLPKGEWRVRPGRVAVAIGRPIAGRADLTRADEKELGDRLRGELARMLESS